MKCGWRKGNSRAARSRHVSTREKALDPSKSCRHSRKTQPGSAKVAFTAAIIAVFISAIFRLHFERRHETEALRFEFGGRFYPGHARSRNRLGVFRQRRGRSSCRDRRKNGPQRATERENGAFSCTATAHFCHWFCQESVPFPSRDDCGRVGVGGQFAGEAIWRTVFPLTQRPWHDTVEECSGAPRRSVSDSFNEMSAPVRPTASRRGSIPGQSRSPG